MRVISQDGTMDFPYEISTIFIYPRIENVIAIQSAGDSEISIIGRYSSKEKAIKAMEMLRTSYKRNLAMGLMSEKARRVFAIGQIPNGYEVHHRDGNKQNNCASNLQILSGIEHKRLTLMENPHILDGMIAYNQGRAIHGRNKKEKRNVQRFKKGKIIQYSLNGEFINSYCNAMEASRNTGVCGRNILQVANKEPYNSKGSVRKQAGGYVWKFEKESEVM